MNKKNILTAAVSLSLVACLSIGATLAYFSDTTKEKQNVFSTGNVKITLVDETNGPDLANGDQWFVKSDDDTGIQFGNVQPGDVVDKKVGVTLNENSSNCYVALKVTVTANDKDGKALEVAELQSSIIETAIANGWLNKMVDKDTMMFYYPVEFSNTDKAAALGAELFEEVTIPADWGNQYAGVDLNIAVQAAAVQSANLEAPVAFEEGAAVVDDTVTSVVELDKLLLTK